ncbi:MAG: FecR domain-containing protein [Bacteroidota bacterium]
MGNTFPDIPADNHHGEGMDELVDFNAPDVKQILSETDQWVVPQERSKAEAWELLQASIIQEADTNDTKVISFQRSWIWLTAAAACIALFFILRSPETAQLTTYEALAGSQTEVLLPDASNVTLNAESSLQLDEAAWEDERTVLLTGEAFFNVEEGSVFSVKTEQGIVKVLGTSFNVYDREEAYMVSCKSGKVKVEVGGSSVLLEKGEIAILGENNQLSKENTATDQVASWMIGEFTFKKATLISVFSELERQFDVSIQVSPSVSDQRLYTGFFSNQNLKEALSAVCEPLGLTFTLQDDGKNVLIR